MTQPDASSRQAARSGAKPHLEPVGFSRTYDTAERLRFVALGVVLGALAIGVGRFWVVPWVARFAAEAPCRTVLGIQGATILWFGVLVGIPLLGSIVVGACCCRTGLRILRAGRFPAPGTRTLRPIRVLHGAAASRMGYLHLLAFVPFLALAVWGYAQASVLSQHQRPALDAFRAAACVPRPASGSGAP